MVLLQELSVELVEMVVQLLDVESICNLRLASRPLNHKASNGRFTAYFHNKTVMLTDPADVQKLCDMTQPHRKGLFLQNLVLVGDASGVIDKSARENAVEALTSALNNLHVYSKDRCLKTLSLQVRARDTDGNLIPAQDYHDWLQIWRMATCVYRDAVQALDRCDLVVEALNVFESIERCSLACDELHFAIQPKLLPTLFSLKKLALSLSHRLQDKLDEPEANQSADVAAASIAQDFKHMLDSCTSLQSLSLHWYNLRTDALPTARLLNYLEASPHFAALKECALRGICCQANALIRFLQNARLRSVELREIDLEDGQFRTIFDHFESASSLEHLYLDNLGERGLVFFDGPGKPHLRTSGRSGPNELGREGEDARKPIVYHLTRGRTLGQSRLWPILRQQRLEYGPPDVDVP